jgi:hypothetical protein
MLLSAAPAAAQWEIQTLAQPGSGSSIAIDRAGAIHVAYGRGYLDSIEVRHRFEMGGVWTDELVGQGLGSPSLRLTSQDVPVLAAQAIAPGGGVTYIKFATRTAGGWLVDDSGSDYEGALPSLALNLQDRPYIAYDLDPIAWYAWSDDAGWHHDFANVPYFLTYGDRTPLQFDPAGRMVLGYVALTGGAEFRHAVHIDFVDQGSWTDERVATGSKIDLQLDAQGLPHVSATDSLAHPVLHVRQGGSWHTEPISADHVANGTAIALGADGIVHVVFTNESGAFYARRQDGTWSVELIEAGQRSEPAIAVWPGGVVAAYGQSLGAESEVRLAERPAAVSRPASSVGALKARFQPPH